MLQKFKFRRNYSILAALLFILEVLIAAFISDSFIRPYFGDFLVVILLYCFIKSFINLSTSGAALLVVLFAYLVEVLQYINLLSLIGLAGSESAVLVIGNTFSWIDILAYTLGILLVLGIEQVISSGHKACKVNNEESQLFI